MYIILRHLSGWHAFTIPSCCLKSYLIYNKFLNVSQQMTSQWSQYICWVERGHWEPLDRRLYSPACYSIFEYFGSNTNSDVLLTEGFYIERILFNFWTFLGATNLVMLLLVTLRYTPQLHWLYFTVWIAAIRFPTIIHHISFDYLLDEVVKIDLSLNLPKRYVRRTCFIEWYKLCRCGIEI